MRTSRQRRLGWRAINYALLFLIAGASAPASAQQSGIPIDNMPLGSALTGAERLILQQGPVGPSSSSIRDSLTNALKKVQAPGPTQLGGVFSSAAVPTQFLTGVDTAGNVIRRAISASDISGISFPLLSNNLSDYPDKAASRTNLGLGTIATQNSNNVSFTGGALTGVSINGGSIGGLSFPVLSGDAATKGYVDSSVTGLVLQTPVDYATAAVLPNSPTYSNGTLGFGATLTAGSNTTLTVDGSVVTSAQRVLVKNQAAPAQNGVYSLTTAGGGVPWVLTRVTDWDQSAEMKQGSYFFTAHGTANAATSWSMSSTSSPVVGTDPINFLQFSASQSYSATGGVKLVGSVFSLDTPTGTGFAVLASGPTIASPTFTGTVAGAGTIPNTVLATNPLNASNINAGTLGAARLPVRASTNATYLPAVATASNSGVMMGLGQNGATITPNTTGTVVFHIEFFYNVGTVNGGFFATLRTGTGTAPTVLDPPAGTARSVTQPMIVPDIQVHPLSFTVEVTGLTVGVPVWFDLQVGNVAGGTSAQIQSSQMVAFELN